MVLPQGLRPDRDTHIAFGLVGDIQMALSKVRQLRRGLLQTVDGRLAIAWKEDAPSRMVLSVVEGDVVICSVPLDQKVCKRTSDSSTGKKRKALTEETDDDEYDPEESPERPFGLIDLVGEAANAARDALVESGPRRSPCEGLASSWVRSTARVRNGFLRSSGPPKDWEDAIPDTFAYAWARVRNEKTPRVYLCACEIRYPFGAASPRAPHLRIKSEWNSTDVSVEPRITDGALRFMPLRLDDGQPSKHKPMKRLLVTLKDGDSVLAEKNATLFSVATEQFSGALAHTFIVGFIAESEDRLWLAREKGLRTELGSDGDEVA